MNRLNDVHPDAKQEPELLGYEFGYYIFKQLLEIDIQRI